MRRQLSLNAARTPTSYDRDIFFLVIIIALAFCLNVRGLIAMIQNHVPFTMRYRMLAHVIAIGSGGIVGLFSRRIASFITDWRDQQ
jgi:hypothetical protein